MLLHPEILDATGAERDRSRLAARAAAPAGGRSRGRPARPGPRRRPTAGAAADLIRAAFATALLGRRRTGTR